MTNEQPNNGGRDVPAPGPDVLADCLLLMAKRHGRTITKEAFLAGLPLRQGRLTPSVFVRAAERIGFSARLVRRRLGDINPMVLPCVLLLTNSRACVLNTLPEDAPCSATGAYIRRWPWPRCSSICSSWHRPCS